ncbi:glutamate ABC transporter substrate-binding protein [Janibacter cremeus]|uniref:Glutamate transport system substrate-binding protein n=1 Tax=Janibacter cremeus TaxID=1285192 RepID=A0A852VTT9_9MICO|nr:glutamate ABC transporter substrate-binding protein [Janibacter cremeus]NYF99368.1 glutamate transport system substrate-binding protein [Janibacter cremeus]
MALKKTKAFATMAALALTLAACGGDSGGDVDVADSPEFDSGTTMAELADSGNITIGVKFDQPGIGFMPPGADIPEGFDIEMAKIVAGKLGIAPEDVTWKETVSDNREPFLENGTVDIVVASYSITDDRRGVVGQAGPYYVTGQQLLVREEDKDKITGPDDLEGVKTCSVTGSTSIKTVTEEYGAEPVPFDTYSACVTQLENGSVDVVTTDGSILLGYAAEAPDELEVVGDTFSEERYGVGFSKGDNDMCTFLHDTIQESFEDGSWAKAFESTLGKSGVDTPEPPKLDEGCKA